MAANTLVNGNNDDFINFNRRIGTQIRQGKGITIWKDGSKEEGWYRNNLINGKGRIIYASGGTYEGQLKDDTPNGFGE